MQTKIEIKDLNKTFGDLHVLKDVNLKINKGEKICIIGPSGSGKSTLLRCINGLETANSGEIIIDNEDVLNKPLSKNIGMVFQQFNLFHNLSVLDNITLAPICNKKMKKAEARENALKLLEQMGIADKAKNYPHQLSGGQKQRVSIARALAMNPEILLFDEPTSALDSKMTNEVLEIISSLASTGITMLIVTHELGFVKKIADRVVFVDSGSIITVASTESFFNNPDNEIVSSFLNGYIK